MSKNFSNEVLSPKDRQFARFMTSVYRELDHALEKSKRDGSSQKELAERLGLSESAISKYLNGRRNLTLRSLSDLTWALEAKPVFEIAFSDGGGNGSNYSVTSVSSEGEQNEISDMPTTTVQTSIQEGWR